MPNNECQKIVVECISLSKFVKQQAEIYQEIVLKLDIEGAEYEVLEDMIYKNALKNITTLHCEFHWEKIGMPEQKHKAFVSEVMKYVDLSSESWDALDFSIHQNSSGKFLRLRKIIIDNLINNKSIFGHITCRCTS